MTLFVPLNSSGDFSFPKGSITLGPYKISAAFVCVPKATINENNCPVFGKNNIWFSWKTGIILPIAKSF
jgi:hypothetical protein